MAITMASLNHPNSQFDRFLFATVIERHDLALTVLSMLSRLDVDPWQEAARLSELSKAEATSSLSATIWKANSSFISTTEATNIASELVSLLPSRDQLAVLAMTEQSADLSSVWLICAVLFFVMMALAERGPKSNEQEVRLETIAAENSKQTLPSIGENTSRPSGSETGRKIDNNLRPIDYIREDRALPRSYQD
jgi:hypothetical protein